MKTDLVARRLKIEMLEVVETYYFWKLTKFLEQKFCRIFFVEWFLSHFTQRDGKPQFWNPWPNLWQLWRTRIIVGFKSYVLVGHKCNFENVQSTLFYFDNGKAKRDWSGDRAKTHYHFNFKTPASQVDGDLAYGDVRRNFFYAHFK